MTTNGDTDRDRPRPVTLRTSPPVSEEAASGDLADRMATGLGRLPRAVVEPVVRGLDGFYLAFQSALKTFGVVADNGPPLEETRGDRRYGVLPRREGRWPEFSLPLPATAVYVHYVESLFRRGAVWRVGEPWEKVAEKVGATVRAAWPEAADRERQGLLDLRHRGGGLESMVKVVAQEDGSVILSMGQKSLGMRFTEAERLLVSSGGEDT